MAAPPEFPVFMLAIAAAAGLGALVLTNKSSKEKFSTSPKKLMIHNSTKVDLYSPTLGKIKSKSTLLISNTELIFGSQWYHQGRKFLTLGSRDDIDLFHSIESGHLYLGGVAGVYVYIDASDGSNPEQGPKELAINNLSDLPLRLKGIPPVPPRTEVIYRGPGQGSGLDLGVKFIDLDQRFESFQMNDPITRIFFGVASSEVAPKSQINLTGLDMKLGYRNPRGPMPPGGELVGTRS